MHAWVEVRDATGSWVPVLPQEFVPDRNKQPNQLQTKSEQQKVGALVPPPAGVNPPSVLQGPDQAQNATNIKKPPKKLFDPASWPWWLRFLLLYVVLPAVALLAVYGAIRGLKALRRRRHATRGPAAARIAWAWSDLMETARSYGHRLPRRATRLEQAEVLGGRADTHALATAANAHVFGPDDPGPEEAHAYWQLDQRGPRRPALRGRPLAPHPGRPRRAAAAHPRPGPHPSAPDHPPPPADAKGHRLVKLKFTLRSAGEVDTDLVATVDATTTVGQLAEYLVVADPARAGAPAPDGHDQFTLSLVDEDFRALDHRATIAEGGLRSGVHVAVTRARDGYADGARAVATAVVTAGPDAGREVPLAPGTAYIGRGRGCEVRVADASVSRRHAKLLVTDVAEVVDLGSSNGVVIGGDQVDRAVLKSGDRFRLGETEIELRMLAGATGVVGSRGVFVPFSRSPRIAALYRGREWPIPELPERPKPERMPWLTAFAPAVFGLAMFAVLKNPLFLLFMLLSPVMLFAHYAESRRHARQDFEQAMEHFREDLGVLVAELKDEQVREVAGRQAEHPSAGEAVQAVVERSPLLWTRRRADPGFLELRLGLGTLPSRNPMAMPQLGRSRAEAWLETSRAVEGLGAVSDVPVTGQPLRTGALGVSGPRVRALEAARGLMAQVVGLHSPADVVVAAFASPSTARDWDWLKWVPHTASPHSPVGARHLASSGPACASLLTELEELLAADSDAATAPGPASAEEDAQGFRPPALPADRPAVVVLVEDDAPVERSRLVQLAENGWRRGIVVLWVAPTTPLLPAACRTFVEVSADAASDTVGYVGEAVVRTPVSTDTADAAAVERAARLTAPVVDSGVPVDDDSDLPRSVSFLSLVGPELAEAPGAVIERWGESRSILTGPYAAAATGRTQAGQPARRRRPVAAGNLLDRPARRRPARPRRWHDGRRQVRAAPGVDPRHGRGPLAAAADLPARRLQGRLGVPRLRQPAAHRRPGHRPVAPPGAARPGVAVGRAAPPRAHPGPAQGQGPRRARAPRRGGRAAEPGHRRRRVRRPGPGGPRVRRRRRQRRPARPVARPAPHPRHPAPGRRHQGQPARQHQPADGAADGRRGGQRRRARHDRGGLLRPGPAGPRGVQVRSRPAHAVPDRVCRWRGPPGRAAPPVAATSRRSASASGTPWERPSSRSSRDEVQEDLGPDRHPADRHPDRRGVDGGRRDPAARASRGCPRWPRSTTSRTCRPASRDDELVIGISDDPDSQTQPSISFRPDIEGNLAVFGSCGSGKSAFLRTIAVAAGFTVRGGPCHVYGLDFGNRGLAMLEGLPHVGSIIYGGDHERARAAADHAPRDDRRAGGALLAEERRHHHRLTAGWPARPTSRGSWSWSTGWRRSPRRYDHGPGQRWVDQLTSIAADGRPVGVHLVVTADQRSGMWGALSSAIQQRVVLRMATVDDYRQPRRRRRRASASPRPPAARCVHGREVQVAVLGGSAESTAQARAIAAFGDAVRRAGGPEAPPIRSLPERVELSVAALRSTRTAAPSSGISSTTLRPVGFTSAGRTSCSGPRAAGAPPRC